MMAAAERGEVAPMYSGGYESRSADIEAGAGRSADDLVADVRTSIYRLEQTWAGLSPTGWQGHGMMVTGEVAVVQLPWRRWREAEVHRIDLGRGYRFADLPAEYVRLELVALNAQWASRKPMGLTELPAAALALAPADRLAWLTGRAVVDGLEPAGIF
jgi:maleylpyruvate isomerase